MRFKKPQTAGEVIAFLEEMGALIYNQGEDLDLRNERTSDETLLLLEKLPAVKTICLQGTKITDQGLRNLSSVSNLKELDLRSCKKITDRGLGYVSKITSLERLELYDTFIGDQGLENIAGLRNLERLGLHATQVTDAGLPILKWFGKLASLQLGGARSLLTDKGLEHTGSLKGLEWLELSESRFTDACLIHLRDLLGLRYLYLQWTPITGSGLRNLATLTRLQHLYARDSQFNDQALAHLGPLTALKDLGLDGTKVTDKGLNHLKGLTKLKNLSLKRTPVTKKGKAALKKALPKCHVYITEDADEEDKYDTEYFWNNPPRCVAGFTLKPARKERATTYGLICQCGNDTGKVLGYPLSDYKPSYAGPACFVGSLGFYCPRCRKTTEIIDTEVHGYDGELGSSCTIRGEGQRVAFQCPKCRSEPMSLRVHFEYDGGELDLKADEPTINVQDYFGSFEAKGKCAKCRHEFSVASFELG